MRLEKELPNNGQCGFIRKFVRRLKKKFQPLTSPVPVPEVLLRKSRVSPAALPSYIGFRCPCRVVDGPMLRIVAGLAHDDIFAGGEERQPRGDTTTLAEPGSNDGSGLTTLSPIVARTHASGEVHAPVFRVKVYAAYVRSVRRFLCAGLGAAAAACRRTHDGYVASQHVGSRRPTAPYRKPGAGVRADC